MLKFNPHFRYEAERLLKSRLFDAVRDPRLEVDPEQPIKIMVDDIDEVDLDGRY